MCEKIYVVIIVIEEVNQSNHATVTSERASRKVLKMSKKQIEPITEKEKLEILESEYQDAYDKAMYNDDREAFDIYEFFRHD